MTELATPRLLLRHWLPGDSAAFARMNADREVMRHFPGPLDAGDSDALLRRIAGDLDERGWGLWALEERANGRLLGFTGLAPVSFDAPFAPAIEIGWRMVRSHWRRGLATEAARAALAFAFDELTVTGVVSFTTVGNERSRAVMRRLGMTHDPADDFEHPLIPEGHLLRPHVLYRLKREAHGSAGVDDATPRELSRPRHSPRGA